MKAGRKGMKAAAAVLLACLVLAAGVGLRRAGAAAPGQVAIVITDAGMTPAEATAPPGLVHLSVENRSAAEGLTLRVAGEGGAVVRELPMPEKVRQLATELELGPGAYTVTEVSHPSWSCRLTVQ